MIYVPQKYGDLFEEIDAVLRHTSTKEENELLVRNYVKEIYERFKEFRKELHFKIKEEYEEEVLPDEQAN